LKFTAFELGGLWNFTRTPLELLKSLQGCPWLVGEEGSEVAGQIPVRGWRGVGGDVASEHQEVKAHLLEVLGRGGDDRRGLSHDGRGGGGWALVSEEVPGEEEGEAWAQQLQEDEGKLLEQWNWAEEGRRYKLDGGRSLPAKGRTAVR
jgi:hypothetical protein